MQNAETIPMILLKTKENFLFSDAFREIEKKHWEELDESN